MLCLALAAVLACSLVLAADTAKESIGPVIGIDLGTTYSCVGVYKDGRVQIIANDQGNRITPSYVAFTDTERLIGDAAKNQAALNPENTVFDVKRLVGRTIDDKNVQKGQRNRKSNEGDAVVRFGRKGSMSCVCSVAHPRPLLFSVPLFPLFRYEASSLPDH